MAKEKPDTLEIKAFATHHVITPPNPLRKVLRRIPPDIDHDDPVARAEQALAGLSGEFKQWMTIEADRLSSAHAVVLRNGFSIHFDRKEQTGNKTRLFVRGGFVDVATSEIASYEQEDSPDVADQITKIVRASMPKVSVLSYNEIHPALSVRTAAVVRLEEVR